MKQANSYLIPLGAAAMGAVGGILRSRQLQSGYDAQGLPLVGSSSTILLLGASAAFVIVLVMLALSMGKGRSLSLTGKPVAGALGAAGGLLVAISAVAAYPGASQVDESVFYTAALFVTVIAGICIFLFSFMPVAGRKSPGALALVPVFCLCVRLIYTYKGMSADPVIIDYIFQLLAIILFLLCLFMLCGDGFGETKPRLTLVFALSGEYFAVISLWESLSFSQSLFFIGCGVFALSTAVNVLQGTVEKV